MDPQRWQEIDGVFQHVFELPAHEQHDYLEANHGNDPELIEEVLSLLGAEMEDVAFLDKPIRTQLELDKGFELDNYQIISELGRGGMGVVYLCEQFKPVRRKVALKLISNLTMSEHVLRRFKVEQLALARMNHTYVARFFESNTLADGRPYFVMEYVEGTPITEYCDRKKMTLRQRMALMVKVCQGVDHAHLNGIIHRDIKPTNVLITEENGEPVPKIIDFGIARSLGGDTQMTQGMMPGTYRYMSPEQAGFVPTGGGFSVDQRTDVYSLGVLLYELLVGEPPRTWSGETPLPKILSDIMSGSPERPGHRWSRLQPMVQERLASHRSLSLSRIKKELKGEPGWICMRALELERDRRYHSAHDMAQDLESCLEGLPISAAPLGFTYGLRKFVQRHKLAVGVAAVMVSMCIAFVVLLSMEHRIAMEQRDQARLELQRSRKVTDFLIDTFEASNQYSDAPGNAKVSDLLDIGVTNVREELKDQPEVLSALLDAMGRAYLIIGLREKADPLMEEALAIRKQVFGENSAEVAWSRAGMASLSWAEGDYPKSLELMAQAAAVFEGPENFVYESMTFVSSLTGYYMQTNQYNKAEALCLELIERMREQNGPDSGDEGRIWGILSNVYIYNNRYNEGIHAMEESRRIVSARYDSQNLSVIEANLRSGSFLSNGGRYAMAERALLDIFDDVSEANENLRGHLGYKQAFLGRLYRRWGKPHKAGLALDSAYCYLGDILGPWHESKAYILKEQAKIAAQLQDFPMANMMIEAAIAILRGSGIEDGYIGPELAFKARLARWQNQPEQALEWIGLAMAEADELQRKPDLFVVNEKARIHLHQDQLEAAREAIDIYRAELDPNLYLEKAQLHWLETILAVKQGRIADYDRSVELAEDLEQKMGRDFHMGLARTRLELAQVLADKGYAQRSKPLSEKALTAYEYQLGNQHPLTLRAANLVSENQS